MGYFYAIMWFAVGLILIFSISKENKVFYFAGGFFLLLGGWWLADSIFPNSELFGGAWGAALRIVTFAALVVLSVFFIIERRRNIKKDMEREMERANSDSEEEP